MQSVNEKLKKIRDALGNTSAPVYHYTRPSNQKPCWIVWQEDGSSTDMWSNNQMSEQQLHGTIDLYTKAEFDPVVDEVQAALNSIMTGWSLQSVEYEDETSLIHYEWEWSV